MLGLPFSCFLSHASLSPTPWAPGGFMHRARWRTPPISSFLTTHSWKVTNQHISLLESSSGASDLRVENSCSNKQMTYLFEKKLSTSDNTNLYLGSRVKVKGEYQRFSHPLIRVFDWVNVCCVPGSATVLPHCIHTITLGGRDDWPYFRNEAIDT